MKLSEFDRTKLDQIVGTHCLSSIGTPGVVKELLPKDREDVVVVIDWQNGHRSRVWLFEANFITVVENPTSNAITTAEQG